MSYRELGINETDGLIKHYGKTFLWMALALVITAGVAFYVYDSYLWLDVMYAFEGYGAFILLIAQLVLVVVISALMKKISFPVMLTLFFVYSALTGVNLSVLPMVYGFENMAIAFVCASLLFVNMGIIGFTMKRDLSKFSNILIGGLITLVIVTLINNFMHLEMLDSMMNYFGVVLFMGLTAYDMQKVKHYYHAMNQGDEAQASAMTNKISIYCALQLYLDFINMFMYILRILGRNRNN